MKSMLLAMAFSVALTGAALSAEELSYVDLIAKLTDMEELAVLPVPGETCAQWSSYDRASRYDAGTGKYVRWDANGDGGGIIRTEGNLLVIAEMEGPGCIWRIWSAQADGGHVKIYLDGATEPAVDLPFIGYFNRKNAPFVHPSFVHTTAKGLNSYVPIPYQKSCKIVAEKGWGRYYHFTYETFPEGTVVPTFTRDLSNEETMALRSAGEFLRSGVGADPAGKRYGEATLMKRHSIPARGTVVVADLKGERAITAIKVRTNWASTKDASEALRELVLRIAWDGEMSPSVFVPLGDFFGTAPGINTYRSLPLGMTDDGFYCYWYMPFAESALVELVNDGEKARSVEFSVTHAPLSRPAAELGRFHAKWHRDAFLPAEPERTIDWTMLKTSGTGRYCGVMLHVWNPRGRWWGEGDEKFFVDGEKFPSTIGTGSEDYFGYAWCSPELFQNAYHNQTISMGNRGHISVNRWHIADNVPFQSSFEGAIEKYFPNNRPTLYDCTVYWYLAPVGTDPYGPAALQDRTGYYIQPKVVTVPGALEGEQLRVRKKTGGNSQTQDMVAFGDRWSGDAQLFWTGAAPGDKLVLALRVPSAGTYEVKLQMTKARDYGIVQLYLDDDKLGSPIDLYNPSVIPTGPIPFAKRELKKGLHTLTVEIVGANDLAAKSYLFGLDYIRLEPVE
jgi:hypothetical protein